jgi:uncharacterized protein (TIRG00374 family)
LSEAEKKNNNKVWLSLLTSLLFLLLFFALRGVPSIDDWSFVSRKQFFGGIIALMCSLYTALLARGWRWNVILSPYLREDRVVSNAVYGLSFVTAAFTPMRAGEMVRVVWLKNKNISMALGVGAIFAERLQDLLMLIIMMLFSLRLLPGMSDWLNDLTGILVAVTIALYFGLILFPLEKFKKLIKADCRSSLQLFCSKTVANFIEGIAFLKFPTLHIKVILLSVFIWFLHVTGFSLFFYLLDNTLPFYTGMLVLVFVNISGLLHLTPGNLGVYEMVGSVTLEMVGMNSSETVAIMCALHAMVLLLLLVYGFLCWLIISVRSNGDFTLQGKCL